jgi:hypothetical protein
MSNKSGFAGPVTIVVGGVLALFPLLYILSAGPMIGLMSRGYISEQATITVYSPLDFVCQNCTPLGEGMCWYIDLFRPADEFEIQPGVVYEVPSAVQPAGATTRQPPPVY